MGKKAPSDVDIMQKMLLTGNRGLALALAFVSVDAFTQATIVNIAVKLADANRAVEFAEALQAARKET